MDRNSVDELRQRLEGLEDAEAKARTRLGAIRARKNEIREELADLHEGEETDSGETERLRQEIVSLRGELAELIEVVPKLQGRIEEARQELHRAAVEEMIGRARKVAGGLVGEHPRHLERAKAYERKAEESRSKADEAAGRANMLADAGEAVDQLLQLGNGGIRRVSGRGSDLQKQIEAGKLRRAARSALGILEREGLLTDEARTAVLAGIESLDDEEERRRWTERQEEVRSAQAREAEQAREEVDAWLRGLLEGGPVLRDRIMARAKRDGVLIGGSPVRADLRSARRRLDVVPLIAREEIETATWWGLPGTWSEERFQEAEGGDRSPASMVQG